MPELPEVENVRASLSSMGLIGQTFQNVELRRAGLRAPFPTGLSRRLKGQSLTAIHRRAKYLLFETESYFLISHLGMTGSWRVSGNDGPGKHDHAALEFTSGLKIVFNDPRRFGVLDLAEKSTMSTNRWFRHLGVEPLDGEFHGDWLWMRTRGLKGSIKGFLMDQRHVVGVGNIYASEALFAAGVRPARPAGKITSSEAEKLVRHIRRILRAAIAAGGSTIRDYRNSNGESGRFQSRFKVYDRKGEPCPVCKSPVRSRMIAGRNSFWCGKCQR